MTNHTKLRALLQLQRSNFLKLSGQRQIERDALVEFKGRLSEPLIKVILGPRRAGKSTFALQLCAEQATAWLNFDDDNLLRFVEEFGTSDLTQDLKDVYQDFEYLILDEVQNLPRWELFVNRLHREGINLIVTGSNANLLSRELATHLTGRYLEIEILPFSWQEFKRARDQALIDDYLSNGGFPEVVLGKVRADAYLSTLSDAILLKDIVNRYSIRQPARLRALWSLVSAQFAQKFSISKLKNVLEFQSKTTLQNYLEYLKASYLCLDLLRYSHKYKEQLKAARKNYLIDLGFVACFPANFDTSSRKLENLVFLALYRLFGLNRQALYYYFTTTGKEVDFIVRDNLSTKALFQVCYALDNQSTREREIAALLEARLELSCDKLFIVTKDTNLTLFESGQTIEVLALEEFLNQASSGYLWAV